ncbi:MAG: restriction endonuclease [Alphaproteobacteria bacterium]|nr:restriction endonuclease [Alphaproteobacteria bacterium]
MAIPEFNEIKAPALQFFAADDKLHKISEIFSALAEHFQLTEEERNELLPSGTQRRWHNRANWACYDLFRAGLLDRPKKGLYVITEAGKKLAAENPKSIDRDFLMQYPQFVQFAQASGAKKAEPVDKQGVNATSISNTKAETPEERIDTAYQVLNSTLRKELLDQVKSMDPFKFEHLVVDLLVAMGYGGSREEAAQVTKASGDEGIDGIINEDRLGLDVIYIQAKRWQQPVGRKEIQSFVGALAGQQAHKGVFITTSGFINTAIAYAKQVPQKVILIDGEKLTDLMVKHNIGVALSHAYEVKHIDSDYFEED